MQVIETKFLGPTNTKGNRVKAKCWLTSIIIAWDHSLNVEENHHAAIEALICKLNNDRSGRVWEVLAIGESVNGKGKTAIIDLV